jgi:hypothetical protein
MAHYAFLDSNNVVVEVITGRDETEIVNGISDWEDHYGNFRGMRCLRTSYNTTKGVHLFGGEPFRKNYAGVGFIYDADRDAFIPPKPFDSWILNDATCWWEAPIPMPTDGKYYIWDESSLGWVEPNVD